MIRTYCTAISCVIFEGLLNLAGKVGRGFEVGSQLGIGC